MDKKSSTQQETEVLEERELIRKAGLGGTGSEKRSLVSLELFELDHLLIWLGGRERVRAGFFDNDVRISYFSERGLNWCRDYERTEEDKVDAEIKLYMEALKERKKKYEILRQR